jgi:hypothetical protein
MRRREIRFTIIVNLRSGSVLSGGLGAEVCADADGCGAIEIYDVCVGRHGFVSVEGMWVERKSKIYVILRCVLSSRKRVCLVEVVCVLKGYI